MKEKCVGCTVASAVTCKWCRVVTLCGPVDRRQPLTRQEERARDRALEERDEDTPDWD